MVDHKQEHRTPLLERVMGVGRQRQHEDENGDGNGDVDGNWGGYVLKS